MKKLLMLVMVLGLLVSGCAGNSYTTKGSWQPKNGQTMDKLQEDYQACRPLVAERERHSQNAQSALLIGQMLTIPVLPLNLALCIAGSTVQGANSGYGDRCMKDKGYEWKENKGAEEK